MIVTVRRTGGVTGVPRTYTIDSSRLREAQQRDLEGAVDALRDATAEKHPDGFRYHVSLDGEEFLIGECWITQTLVKLAK